MFDVQFLRTFLLDRYDPDDLVDLLELSSEELLDAFEHKLTKDLSDLLGCEPIGEEDETTERLEED